MIDIEAVKAESIEHSRNLSDWNNEALLKDFLWVINETTKEDNDTFSDRYVRDLRELLKRLREKIEIPDYDKVLNDLFKEQINLSQSCYGSPVNRNAELRKIEAILEIKNPIPDILLP